MTTKEQKAAKKAEKAKQKADKAAKKAADKEAKKGTVDKEAKNGGADKDAKNGGASSKVGGLAGKIMNSLGKFTDAQKVADVGDGKTTVQMLGESSKNAGNFFLILLNWILNDLLPLIIKFVKLIIAIIIIIFLFYFLLRRRFRFVQLYRTADFDNFSNTFASEFFKSLTVIKGGIEKPPEPPSGVSILDSQKGALGDLSQKLSTLLAGRSINSPGVTDDLMTYLKFGESVKNSNTNIHEENLYANSGDRFMNSKGLLDATALSKFRTQVIDSIEGILSICTSMSESIDQQNTVDSSMDADTMIIVTHIHLMRVYAGYMPEVKKLSSIRSSHAVLTDYYFPLVANIITKRIPPLWTGWGDNFMSGMDSGISIWTKLGKILANMPCSLAYSDAAERAERCGGGEESFVDEEEPNVKKKNDDSEEEEVTEGFIGMLKAVADFFIGIKDVALAIAQLFVDFPKDPVGSIIRLLTILIGLTIGLILICIYAILSACAFGYILGFFLGWFWAWSVAIWGTIMYLILIIILFAPYLVLWLLDLVTGGLIIKLMRCEQLPDEWLIRSNYVYGNKFERSLIYLGMVMRPCANRFRPDLGGCMCTRQNPEIPDFCPQQQLAKLFLGRSIPKIGAGPVVYDKYRPLPNFKYALPRTKARILSRAYNDKEKWTQQCSDKLDDYAFLTRHICMNHKNIATNIEADEQLVRSLCHSAMCGCDRDNMINASLCTTLVEKPGTEEVVLDDVGNNTAIMKKMMMVALVIVSCVVILTTLKKVAEIVIEDIKKG